MKKENHEFEIVLRCGWFLPDDELGEVLRELAEALPELNITRKRKKKKICKRGMRGSSAETCLDCLLGQQTRHGVFCAERRNYVYETCADFWRVQDLFDLDLPTPFTAYKRKEKRMSVESKIENGHTPKTFSLKRAC